jgi:hypothetical protein
MQRPKILLLANVSVWLRTDHNSGQELSVDPKSGRPANSSASSSLTMIFQVIGLCGFIIYSLFFFLSINQLIHHFIPYYEPFYTSRKIFHLLFSLYCLFQAISLICFCQGYESYTKICYICHIFGTYAENIAISAINLLWAKLVFPKYKISLFLFLSSGFLLYLSYLTFMVHDMVTSSKSFSDWADESPTFLIFLMLEPCVLGINGIMFLFLGYCIWNRLIATPSWELFEIKTKSFVHSRLVTTIAMCSVSIFFRIFFQMVLMIKDKNHLSYDVKWIFLTWIPNLIPALIFLYALVSEEEEIE